MEDPLLDFFYYKKTMIIIIITISINQSINYFICRHNCIIPCLEIVTIELILILGDEQYIIIIAHTRTANAMRTDIYSSSNFKVSTYAGKPEPLLAIIKRRKISEETLDEQRLDKLYPRHVVDKNI